MNRLTKELSACDCCDNVDCTGYTKTCELKKAYDKLAQYEELGFEPEEVALLAKFYKEQTSVAAITANLKIVDMIAKLNRYEKLEAEGKLKGE